MDICVTSQDVIDEVSSASRKMLDESPMPKYMKSS
jgi:hypothetical protein